MKQLTPPVGYNSWNGFKLNISSKMLRKQAEMMIALGLQQAGYRYFVVDDGWQHRRWGKPLSGNERFGDMGQFARKIIDLGFQFGIYTTPWAHSYGGFPGSKGSLREDLKQFIEWGVSFIKYDWNMMASQEFNYRSLEEINEQLYALNGEHIFLSVANTAPIEQGAYISQRANMWRTTGDIVDTPESVFGIGAYNLKWREFQSPGRFNDPDMLVVGTLGLDDQFTRTRLTPIQQRAHFALWCFMGSPLFLGCDLTKLNQNTLQLITDQKLIEINQQKDVTMPEILSWKNGELLLQREYNGKKQIARLNVEKQTFEME